MIQLIKLNVLFLKGSIINCFLERFHVASKEDFKYFVNDINIFNSDKYLSLIEGNIDNLNNLLLANNEAKRNGFDFFNLSEEQKELIQIKTDININFKMPPRKNKLSEVLSLVVENFVSDEIKTKENSFYTKLKK